MMILLIVGHFMRRGLIQTAGTTLCGLITIFGISFNMRPAIAAESGIIQKGDAVVTGFSGTKTEKNVPSTVHPLDRTFIDLGGSSAQVFDLTTLGGGPRGQLSDAPSKLQIKASDVGQVFGVTLDDGQGTSAPNAYLTSTSMYGLQIISKAADGKIDRLVKGAPGAQWMPGQFGLDKGGSPGAIWKVDGRTGAVSLFATVKLNDRDNAGAGLGNITFDGKTQQLFVSDLQTGMIHRITLDGKERDIYDHGVVGRKAAGLEPLDFDDQRVMDIKTPAFSSEDPKTWGYTDVRRRVFGLAVNAGRLYYSVADGPTVWSVAIDNEGDFGSDSRIEIDVKDQPSAITDILFDGSGMLYLSQRGAGAGSYDYTKFAVPQKSAVLRYKWDEREVRWAPAPDEYAIGLPLTYRGTQGGIASNYGYDKYGNIDYGKCRQTLWTTGEHLREATGDTVKVSSGGAKIVHGLQGNYKSRVRPANEPPYETWFTDYDNHFNDQDAFGHIGDVAIYSPCEPSYELPDAPRLIYIEPPVDRPDLIIDKRCFPGAIGSRVRCTITVTNTGSQLPSEDVTVKDVTKITAGPGEGDLVPIIEAVPADPSIRCSETPDTKFSCRIPASLLTPGASTGFDVFINTRDIALQGNLGFRNCASINHPNGWGRACAEGGTDIVVEKSGPETCLPGGACKFAVTITNAGTMPFDGDLMLADAMTIGGSVTGAAISSVTPPLVCSEGDTGQLPFTCVTRVSLMPGEQHTHFFSVTMPSPGGFFAENCFGAVDPDIVTVGGLPPQILSSDGNIGPGNPSCAVVHVPVPGPDLSIEKTTENGGMCVKDPSGDFLACPYQITITNHDSVDFNGPISLSENMPVGAVFASVTPAAAWSCADGPPATCDSTGPITIPAGGTTSLGVVLAITVADTEANLCTVPNTVEIRSPVGSAPNIDPSNDQSSATASTNLISFVDPVTQITMVMCDPTNLKVQKTAKGPCTKSGDGFQCEYDVTITNTGPDPYKGPLRLDEKFGAAPSNVSFDGDLTCTGSGADFKCEKPIVSMVKGDVIKLTVKATMPDNGTCAAPNTAKMTFPPVGSKGNGRGDDDSATATASIPSEKCNKPQTVVTPPPSETAKCPDGLPIPRSGKCPCSDGGTWNSETNSCGGDDYVEPEKPKGCSPGVYEVKTGDGRCVCREGYSKEDGRCVKDDVEEKQPRGCTPGDYEHKTNSGRCVCDDGYERSGGRCIRETPPVIVVPRCPRGTHGIAPNCKRDQVEEPARPVRKPCPEGYDGDYQPNCRLVRPKGPSAEEICENRGGRYVEGDCVFKRRVPQGCGPGFYSEDGKCRRNEPPAPPKQAEPKQCPPGTYGQFPYCKPLVRPAPPVFKPKPPVFNDSPVFKPKAPVFVPKPRVDSEVENFKRNNQRPVAKPPAPVVKDIVRKPQPVAPQLNNKFLQKAVPLNKPNLQQFLRKCPPGKAGTPPNCYNAIN